MNVEINNFECELTGIKCQGLFADGIFGHA